MRIMALDPGDRRVGVALSDERGVLASPLEVVERRAGRSSLDRIIELVHQHRPEEILVGVPVLPSGDLGPQAEKCLRFAEIIREKSGLPVRTWNESYSTVEASRRRAHSPRRRRMDASLDAEAAAIFLQEYLDIQS